MNRSSLARLAVLLCLAFALPARASDDSERLYSRGLVELHAGHDEAALQAFDAAVAADPADPYAFYYRGVTRARRHDYQGAVADLGRALELRPDLTRAELDLGVALYQQGDYRTALSHLERAAGVADLAADASLFAGLCHLRLGELDAARTGFARAAESNPQLLTSSQYYQGVIAYQQRHWDEAQQYFDAVIAANPESEAAHEAKLFLAQLQRGGERRLRAYGSAGFQYDSNVVLAGDANLGISRKDDGRAVLSAGVQYDALRAGAVKLIVGYEFFQSLHFNLTDFDLQNHRVEAQLVSARGDLHFGLLGRYDYYARGRDNFSNFLQEATVLPWVTWEEDFGRTEVYYRLRVRDFLDSDFRDRDSVNQAPGVRQVVYLGSPDRYAWVGYQFDREDPNRNIDAAARFAYDGQEVNTGLGWLLPSGIRLETGYAYRYERFPRNSLAANSAYDGDPNRTFNTDEGRLDKVNQVVATLRVPVTSYLQVVAGYFGDFNKSNDSQFDYDRHIASLSVEVSY
jgi:tetratricopeptide (TPR) repeat protein